MQPNIILIVAEHFSGLIQPWIQDCQVELPALRTLAERSACFTDARCNSPICGPSRMSLLSGLLPCRNEAYDNGSELPAHIPTFAHCLNAEGYATALCGRMHVHGLDQHRGFGRRLVTEIINPLLASDADWPAAPDFAVKLPPARPLPDFTNSSKSPLYRHDEWVTERAIEFLKGASSSSPFLLTVGYLAAHPAGNPNPALQPFHERYLARRDLRVPSFTEQDFHAMPQNPRHLHLLLGSTRSVFDSEYHRRRQAIWYAGLSFLDAQVGRVMDALESTGLRERTVVVFVADHGENGGAHGLWGKANFYEEAVRIPMYWSGPSFAPGLRRGAVTLLDVFPTFAELAGARNLPTLDGQSLASALYEDRHPTERTAAAEYHGYLSSGGAYMVVEEGRKLCRYAYNEPEFYDLASDPGERNNLAGRGIPEPLDRRLRSIFSPETTDAAVAQYNQRRGLCFRGLAGNTDLRARNREIIRRFREEFPEPWWDGGEFMRPFEKHLAP